MMGIHEIAATSAIALSLTGNVFYIFDTLKGKTKPHLFTWLVWAIVMGVAASVAYTSGAVASAFVIGNGCLMCSIISALAVWRGEKRITRSDWIMFLSALAIIPIWAVTKEPLVAALLATLIDACGYGPTFRKSWIRPQEENLKTFSILTVQSMLSLLAVTPFLMVTGLYPSMIFSMNALLVLLIITRRRFYKRAKAAA